MFSSKNKIEKNLKIALDNKFYKKYRVIIYCKKMYQFIEKKIKRSQNKLIDTIPSIGCISAVLSQRFLENIIQYPQISYVTSDSFAELCGSSIASSNGISLQKKLSYTGEGVGIGLVDSGVYPHPDLIRNENKITEFYDAVSGLKYPYDDNGHGTFMSGILCGSGLNSKGMYKGIAEGSHLYAIKAFNAFGKGYISDILYSIDKIINEKNKFNIKVICLPFEINSNDFFIISLFDKLFKKAIQNNITVVVPCGHNGMNECSMTGISILKSCITAGGLDYKNRIEPFKFSSAGPVGKAEKPDLSAVCSDICSLNSDKSYISERNGQKIYAGHLEKPYITYSGTSCAAAYISGICALLYEKIPDITYKDIVPMIKLSCKMFNINKNIQGCGIPDVYKLLS